MCRCQMSRAAFGPRARRLGTEVARGHADRQHQQQFWGDNLRRPLVRWEASPFGRRRINRQCKIHSPARRYLGALRRAEEVGFVSVIFFSWRAAEI